MEDIGSFPASVRHQSIGQIRPIKPLWCRYLRNMTSKSLVTVSILIVSLFLFLHNWRKMYYYRVECCWQFSIFGRWWVGGFSKNCLLSKVVKTFVSGGARIRDDYCCSVIE